MEAADRAGVLGVLFVVVGVAGCQRLEATSDVHLDALAPLTLEETVRIGSVADPDVGFTRISGVDVDRDGNVYVMEGVVPEIRVYGPDGVLLRRIGRRGSGPGEFEGAPRFGVMGDTVWTFDSRLNRITLFDRQGALVSTGRTDGARVALPEAYGYSLPWRMRPDGTFMSHMSLLQYVGRDEPATGVQPTDRIPVPFVRFDATGAIVDTIGWAPRPPPRMWRPPSEESPSLQTIQIDGRRRAVPQPPTTLPFWEPLVDGYLLVDTPVATAPDDGVFTVTRFDVTGDTVYSRAIHYRPAPYSAAGLDSMAAHAARGEPGGGVPFSPQAVAPDNWEDIARQLRAAMSFPPYMAPIEYPWVGPDESVWIRRWDGVAPMAPWIVLDPEGRGRGRVDLPPTLRPLWTRGDELWAVELDELEVPWLVHYRIGEA